MPTPHPLYQFKLICQHTKISLLEVVFSSKSLRQEKESVKCSFWVFCFSITSLKSIISQKARFGVAKVGSPSEGCGKKVSRTRKWLCWRGELSDGCYFQLADYTRHIERAWWDVFALMIKETAQNEMLQFQKKMLVMWEKGWRRKGRTRRLPPNKWTNYTFSASSTHFL